MRVLILISSAMLLTACSGSVHNCREWPSGGVSNDANGKEIAIYINEGHAAWRSCYEAANR